MRGAKSVTICWWPGEVYTHACRSNRLKMLINAVSLGLSPYTRGGTDRSC